MYRRRRRKQISSCRSVYSQSIHTHIQGAVVSPHRIAIITASAMDSGGCHQHLLSISCHPQHHPLHWRSEPARRRRCPCPEGCGPPQSARATTRASRPRAPHSAHPACTRNEYRACPSRPPSQDSHRLRQSSFPQFSLKPQGSRNVGHSRCERRSRTMTSK